MPRPARTMEDGSGMARTLSPVISGFRKLPAAGEKDAKRNVPIAPIAELAKGSTLNSALVGFAGSTTSRKIKLPVTTPISERSAVRLLKSVPGSSMGLVEVSSVKAPPSLEYKRLTKPGPVADERSPTVN